jgi:nitrate/nitrite-specific signal transduction histidine kinase
MRNITTKCRDAKRRKIVQAAAEYFIQKLLPQKRVLNLDIRILDGLIELRGNAGECWDLKPEHDYTVIIDGSLPLPHILTTLAHELTHVKQFAKKELIFGKKSDIWKGVVFSHATRGKKYLSLPWEKEARSKEIPLVVEFINTLDEKVQRLYF